MYKKVKCISKTTGFTIGNIYEAIIEKDNNWIDIQKDDNGFDCTIHISNFEIIS